MYLLLVIIQLKSWFKLSRLINKVHKQALAPKYTNIFLSLPMGIPDTTD